MNTKKRVFLLPLPVLASIALIWWTLCGGRASPFHSQSSTASHHPRGSRQRTASGTSPFRRPHNEWNSTRHHHQAGSTRTFSTVHIAWSKRRPYPCVCRKYFFAPNGSGTGRAGNDRNEGVEVELNKKTLEDSGPSIRLITSINALWSILTLKFVGAYWLGFSRLIAAPGSTLLNGMPSTVDEEGTKRLNPVQWPIELIR